MDVEHLQETTKNPNNTSIIFLFPICCPRFIKKNNIIYSVVYSECGGGFEKICRDN